MIELFYWPTPNGHKITIFLEEAGLPYEIRPVNISAGDQFTPDFLKISPNNKMPAIIDHAPADGGAPVPIFESGAILTYLGEKTGKFLPSDLRGRKTVMEWLFWQVGGLGPMAGQAGHFKNYAPEKLPYAMQRYDNEVNRLYGVMDRRLGEVEYLAGDYSIADMAAYPWVAPFSRYGASLEGFPRLARWLDAVKARPAVERAYEKGKPLQQQGGPVTDQGRSILFGQTADKIKALAEGRK
jgi:GST-like protein